MKQPKKILLIYLASLVIVLGVNICGNWQYYSSGGNWHFSVFFSLGFTTACWAAFMLLHQLIFKSINWSDRPTYRILSGALIYGVAGAGMMLLAEFVITNSGRGSLSPQESVTNAVYSAIISMVVGLMVTGQQALLHLKKSTEDNERMKREMVQSQYETLKSQVNPHFLFNSLNTLIVMIPQQPEVAVQFVEQLSKVFRYSLQHSNENTIDIAAELKVVQSYLFLNEQRYDGKLATTIKIDPDAMRQKIITQSLLMLVENAIKHNEISHEKPLSVSICNEGQYLVVSNTLQRKTLIERSTNIGLDNIKKRYALATTTPVIIDEANHLFIVKLPLL